MPSERILRFYDSKSFALLGMSRKRDNFAWRIYHDLSKVGKEVYPIHPRGGDHGGTRFYSSLQDLPRIPEAVIICLKPANTVSLLPEIVTNGVRKVWLQRGSYDAAVVSTAERLGLEPIKGCVIMYLPGASFPHRVHRFFHELFTKGYR